MTKNQTIGFLSTQEDKPTILPLDGARVELLRLRIPKHLYGRQVKLDGFLQSNFVVAGFENDVELTSFPYKYELAYQVMVESAEANLTMASPLLLDTVSGVQQPAQFEVEHNTNPNFTISIPCLAGDLVLMASVAETQGGVEGAFVNTRSMNALLF
ncbi:hypothetical protein [Cytobacillus sp. IB215665]|uniref:hypothetical protein n=1 Tax=Cytobacillus sp. IB215665 TaxID=3097357 RepID=UPI002A0F4BB6|nr:hypothetical protein [Cytobacillus sp. IB215665]MDX8366046.1 hypothetical protein [Cytobacillus sp. IB215665]